MLEGTKFSGQAWQLAASTSMRPDAFYVEQTKPKNTWYVSLHLEPIFSNSLGTVNYVVDLSLKSFSVILLIVELLCEAPIRLKYDLYCYSN